MKTRLFYLLFMLVISWQYAQGQIRDCLLNIGGMDQTTIVQVFQLNDVQRDKLEVWSGELAIATAEKEASINELFDTHPQKTDKDLVSLAAKYAELKEDLVGITRQYDQKLLSLFNERQYERYSMLCSEAGRRPIPRLSKLPE